MARQYLPSQEALLSLLAEPQECGGDMRRQAVTLGKLGRIVEGHQLSSTTNIDSFVREGTWRAMPEPCKVISSRLHTCPYFWPNCQKWTPRYDFPSFTGTCITDDSEFTLSICDRHEIVLWNDGISRLPVEDLGPSYLPQRFCVWQFSQKHVQVSHWQTPVLVVRESLAMARMDVLYWRSWISCAMWMGCKYLMLNLEKRSGGMRRDCLLVSFLFFFARKRDTNYQENLNRITLKFNWLCVYTVNIPLIFLKFIWFFSNVKLQCTKFFLSQNKKP